jgi:hypothetical protein
MTTCTKNVNAPCELAEVVSAAIDVLKEEAGR